LFAGIALGAFNPNKNEAPIWKVFCDNLYGGRVDTIVNPGTYSAHVHRVFGGSNFGPGMLSRSPVEQYNLMYHSPCTTCSIKKVDNSAYWTADLYYKWPNGTYSLVPSGGLTVYYLSRGGATGTQKSDPNWQPIPKGLRIVAGDPMRRTYNNSIVAHQAINYVCLNYGGGGFDESSDWSGLKTNKCPNGLRTQVFFPMCWDGKNLDSADHKSHMAYPTTRPNGGDCPATHPVRIPGVFFEHIYQVGKFPHGDGTNNFLWSMGDPTGFGHHGDFLSGWDEKVMAAAIADPKCSNENPDMNFGNTVTACPPLAPFVKDGSEPKCVGLNNPVPLTEDLGASKPISRIPGCYGSSGTVPNCDKSPAGSDNSNTFFIKSQSNGKYLTAKHLQVVYANHDGNMKSYNEVWSYSYGPDNMVTIQSQDQFGIISARDRAQLIGGNQASTWEYWTVQNVAGSTNTVAFKSNRNGKFLTVTADSTLTFDSVNVTSAQTFIIEPNMGGYVPADDGLSAAAAQPSGGLGQPDADLVAGSANVLSMGCAVILALVSVLLF